MRDGAVVEDPLAGRDVPADVAIVEDGRRTPEHRRDQKDCDECRDRRAVASLGHHQSSSIRLWAWVSRMLITQMR